MGNFRTMASGVAKKIRVVAGFVGSCVIGLMRLPQAQSVTLDSLSIPISPHHTNILLYHGPTVMTTILLCSISSQTHIQSSKSSRVQVA